MEAPLGNFPLCVGIWVPPLTRPSWLPAVSSSTGRVLGPSLDTQYLGPSFSYSVGTLGGQVEAEGDLCR